MEEPRDEQLRSAMFDLVRTVDVDLITTKQFIAQLSSRMGGLDLKPRKKYIKATLAEIIDEMQEQDDGAEESSDEDLPPEPAPKKRGGGGLSVEREISAELRDFLGTDKMKMARTEIVKALWVHIRENDLQNPEDKREIILDDKMKRVFGADRFSMFHMAKYVGAHVDPFKPIDLSPKPKDPQKVMKRRKSKNGCKGKTKKQKREGGEKRKPPASFTAPYHLSQELIDVVGEDCLSRPQVTSKLWEYIKARDMQFPEDKRTIICDDKFKLIMDGNDRVTMFQMNKLVSPHLLKRIDATPVENPREETTL